MKRDLDLVRCILISAEKADGPIDDTMLVKCCSDIRKLAFHVELMQSHGLLTACVERDAFGDPISLEVGGLTWDGYDYLDAIRSLQVWNKAKEAISKAVGGHVPLRRQADVRNGRYGSYQEPAGHVAPAIESSKPTHGRSQGRPFS